MNPKHIRAWLIVLVCAGAGAGACGDDNGGGNDDGGGAAAMCGDGRVNGDEECDGTALGNNECSSVGEFTGGELACADDCTFDTTACTGGDDCGNGVIDGDEQCDGTELGGMTCTDVDAGGGELGCADDCTFDTSACEGGGNATSEQIQDARDAADGQGLSLPIEGALVTYVKPALGSDPAGFFIQAEQAGPALFVAVDAATLDPVPAAGDTVSFTITGKTTQDGQPRATALADLTVDASGADVAALVQDIGAASNLLDPIAGFDSELVAMDATIVADFDFAGPGAEAADVATEGLPAAGEIHPRFRLDPALRDSLDLASGCAVRIGPTPLWRFQDTAQPSIWAGTEVTIQSCNAPGVVSATAPDATTVVVSFDRFIDPTTVDVGSFDFDPDLTVTAVEVDGRAITVTTEVQSPQTPYTVTVSGVTDTLSSPIDETAATESFTGFGDFEQQLFIWEVDTDQVDTENAEFIELWNNTGAAINFANEGWYLFLMNGNGDVSYRVVQLGPGTGTLAADDVWVVGNTGSTISVDQEGFPVGLLQNGQDGLLLVRCDACTGPGDFAASFDPGTGPTITSTTSGSTGTKVDAIVYGTQAADPELRAKLLNVPQVTDDGDADSLQRTTVAGWELGAPTPGVE
jgi:hypothetical protein